jgi:hypothetical protein
MITSNQATAAKELLSASKENYSLLKSLIVTAVKDSGTKKVMSCLIKNVRFYILI